MLQISSKMVCLPHTLKACASVPETDAAERRAPLSAGLMKTLRASAGRSDNQTKATKTHIQSQLVLNWTAFFFFYCWETSASPADSGSPRRGHYWKTEGGSTSLFSGTRGWSCHLPGRPTGTPEPGGDAPSHLPGRKTTNHDKWFRLSHNFTEQKWMNLIME